MSKARAAGVCSSHLRQAQGRLLRKERARMGNLRGSWDRHSPCLLGQSILFPPKTRLVSVLAWS